MDSQKVQQILVETEAAAQQVLVTNEEIVAVDYRRQKTREARRALQSERCEDKAWISLGNIFVKMRTEKAINLLEKDLTELNRNMAALQNQQKERVRKLRDLENKPELGQLGFDLKPLTKEWQAMAQALLPSSL